MQQSIITLIKTNKKAKKLLEDYTSFPVRHSSLRRIRSLLLNEVGDDLTNGAPLRLCLQPPCLVTIRDR
eukprot:6194547-Pleurochrysis_carterae.AAC.2